MTTNTYSGLAELWTLLDARRLSKLERARECAVYTIPQLLPPKGAGNETQLAIPYNNVPGVSVTAMASKATGTTLPIGGTPPLRLSPQAPVGPNVDADLLDQELSEVELRCWSRLEASNLRETVYNSYLHLGVIGDVCIEADPESLHFQIHRLDNFCVQRDRLGRVWRLLVREWLEPDALKIELQSVPAETGSGGMGQIVDSKKLEAMYTLVERKPDGSWDMRREFRGKVIETGEFPKDRCRYFVVRWSAVAGEDYGRSRAEEVLGDLKSLDGLTQCLLEGSAINSFLLMLVRPGGLTEISDLEGSRNGTYAPGNPEDVSALRPGNEAQVAVTLQAVQRLEQSIGRSFLADYAVQPRGERVTAFQSNLLASENDQILGSVFSEITTNLMRPVFRLTLAHLVATGQIPKMVEDLLDSDVLKIDIKTGVEALSRQLEFRKTVEIIGLLQQLPDEARASVKWRNFLPRLFANSGLSGENLVMSEAEYQEMIAEQRAAQTADAVALQGIQTLGQQAARTPPADAAQVG